MENVEVKQEIKNSDDGKGILITNDAIEQISNLLKGQSDKKALRVGVRSGGCSGMSYTMDFIGADEINPDDKVYDYSLNADQSFQVVCDPKSLLYIYGMQLDFRFPLGAPFNGLKAFFTTEQLTWVDKFRNALALGLSLIHISEPTRR